ncbi:MAG: glycosyltransferase family 4 protein [Chitinophaga sp.]|uniref:glycosyltransferase family 4 protein n=1 Tax=Chitinophaga sp. TaxID=1869181 RepID=UPI001AFE19C1|nr:glycosyltransferase family 4 protein [Chitinophaga sp.]MBO9732227.1 glycosyltransferase family 4 protein [Chitinophaga sp.]
MKIVVNDHSGHAFPLQLSRQLADCGHQVLHAYSASFQSPKGDFSTVNENGSLEVLPISITGIFDKYSLLKRRRQEIEYARKLAKQLDVFQPEVILSGTTPLFVQQYLQRYCRQRQIRFIYWCQDIYTVAIQQIAKKKLGALGFPIWYYFKKLESGLLRKSHHIVSITSDFNHIFRQWKVQLEKVTCIPNWAPISEIMLVEKNNDWARKYGLTDKTCLVYSGTLGLKHNPAILVAAARHFRQHSGVVFIVISEGLGADYLQKEKQRHGLDNLLVLPFQDFKQMSEVLGTADVLLAILEKEAGIYSVPSKVLTYLCAQKPIVVAMPLSNLSATIIHNNEVGYCVSPDDERGFCKYLELLVDNQTLRRKLGQNGRAYAERTFDIQRIGNEFMEIFNKTIEAAAN